MDIYVGGLSCKVVSTATQAVDQTVSTAGDIVDNVAAPVGSALKNAKTSPLDCEYSIAYFCFPSWWRTSPTKIWDSSYCMVSNCVLILFPLLQPPHAKSKDFWHHSLSWSVLLPQFSEVTNRAQKVQVLVLTLVSLTCRMFTWPFLSIQEPLSFSIWLKTRTLWYLKRHTTAQFYYYEHFSLFWSLRTIVQLKKIKFVKTVDSAA